MQDRGDKTFSGIWITPEQKKNWDVKSIHSLLKSGIDFKSIDLRCLHRFLELSKDDQTRCLNIFDLVQIDNTVIKVHIP